jgi:plasmid maintenance system antidote protein VapI
MWLNMRTHWDISSNKNSVGEWTFLNKNILDRNHIKL